MVKGPTEPNKMTLPSALDCELVRDIAASAGTVVDHDRRADVFTQFSCNDARTGVCRATRSKSDDHGDGLLGRKSLCLRNEA